MASGFCLQPILVDIENLNLFYSKSVIAMVSDVWFSLPVKDLVRSCEFYRALGFSFHPHHDGREDMAALLIGSSQVMLMLTPEELFRSFTRDGLPWPGGGTSFLISIDAPSREAVDALAEKVRAAGGVMFAEPEEMGGWMYGLGFVDPDGHRWNQVYLDWERRPR